MERLAIPSCSGLLDCFNTRQTTYSSPSICCLQGNGTTLMVLALFSFIYQNFFPSSTCTYTFKTSSYKKFLGYTEGGKSKSIVNQLETLPSFGYLWNDDTYKQLLTVSFNDTKTLITVQSAYFQNIFQQMKIRSGTYDRWGRKTRTGSSTYSSLVYTSILKERNISAVETTIELVKLIERRGPLEQGQTAHLSTLSLVERCPDLYRRVTATRENKEVNRILRITLSKGLELLRTHTDIYDVFEGLEFIVPDKVVLSKECLLQIKYDRRIFTNE